MDFEDIDEICSSPIHGSGGQPQIRPVSFTDDLDNTWCEDCTHRGEFINWGKRHGYPALDIHPYAVAEGVYFWQITATQSDEDRIQIFLGLIEMLDAQQGAA